MADNLYTPIPRASVEEHNRDCSLDERVSLGPQVRPTGGRGERGAGCFAVDLVNGAGMRLLGAARLAPLGFAVGRPPALNSACGRVVRNACLFVSRVSTDRGAAVGLARR